MARLRKYPGNSDEEPKNPFSDEQGNNPFADREETGAGATETMASENPYRGGGGAGGSAPRRVGGFETTLPHRGGTVLTLGIAGLFGAAVFAFCWPMLAINLFVTLPAWLMGQADLRAMQAGAMDPEGRGTTRAGYLLGIFGTLATLLLFVVIAWISFSRNAPW